MCFVLSLDMEVNNTLIALFGVKSHFTNVPLEKVIEICIDTLYKIKEPTISRMNLKSF